MGDLFPPEFDQFWAIYPRKVGKLAAQKAFERALRRTPFVEILVGLRRYVADCTAKGTSADYICHASTWLNGGRWEDEVRAAIPDPPNGKAPTVREKEEALWRMRLKNYRPGGFWNPNWGNRPEDGGTPGSFFIPGNILAEWRRLCS